MAPLTRCRAGVGRSATALMAQYYAQRASSGLLISEATAISPEGCGYPDTPGIWNAFQAQSWRQVTDAVHARGGRIACQLWHVGAISQPYYQPFGRAPVSASAFHPGGETRTPIGRLPRVEARALTRDEIRVTLRDYAHAARLALEAGFDAIELHGANGYLIEQFLRDGINTRTDEYGGSVEGRVRFLREAVEAILESWPPSRVGVRLSPSGLSAGRSDSDQFGLYRAALRVLDGLGVAFAHVMEAPAGWGAIEPRRRVGEFRDCFGGTLIANAGFTYERAEEVLARGEADAVAFGTLYISNPDLVERFRRFGAQAPLNEADASTYYTPGPKGYTDYPMLTPDA
jgi:N-ethylmaleimide reductase